MTVFEGTIVPSFYGMDLSKERIEQWFAEAEMADEIFLVDVKDAKQKWVIEIESDSGIAVNDCIKVSRLIEGKLLEKEIDIALEVTSPGADSSFKVKRQYNKNVGRTVEVLTNDHKKSTGMLVSVNDDSIILEKNVGKKGQIKKEELIINFDQIMETKAVISFKR